MSIESPASNDVPRVLIPKRHRDLRGWFSETFREDRLRELGIPCRFVQENQSSSKRAGTLRGLHFQLPPSAQAKLITVARGRVLDVIVDIRNGSPTYGKHVSVELSSESGHQLYVPVGFAHGFVTLEDEVIIVYKVSDYYAPAYDKGIRWNDPDIGLSLPVRDIDLIISDKDRNLPLLKEFVSPFSYNGIPLDPLTVADSTPL
jgi:dTDP-4-dehydrorhamnose 3,5-epimerase